MLSLAPMFTESFSADENKALREQINGLQEVIANLEERNKSLEQHAEALAELVRLLRGERFAPKSEKAHPDQLRLKDCFDEAEASLAEPEEKEVKGYKRGQPKRKKLPSGFPRRTEIVDLPEEEKTCSGCGSKLSPIGEVQSEKLDIEPMVIEIVERIRKKYACKRCEACVKTAELPKDPIPKSIATAGTLAFVITNKYQDRLPLYAIEGILQRNGIEIPRNTLSGWMVKCGDLVQPLINLLEERLLDSGYIKMDETTVQVLKEPGKKATTKSYMWVRWRAGPEPIVLFEYDPTRSSQVPERLLDDFTGYLQVDGYVGYDSVCARKEITRVGCMAHVRRKFKDAAKNAKKKAKANHALKLIGQLYAVEKKVGGKPPELKLEFRQKLSKPVFQELEKWLLETKPTVAPKSLLGKAIIYAMNEWENVAHYLNDGELDIDNNLIENAIRPFAVGRKNWLFSNSVSGARSSANLYSLIETAKANGVEPFRYLKHVLTELPRAETIEQIELLLPARFAKNQA